MIAEPLPAVSLASSDNLRLEGIVMRAGRDQHPAVPALLSEISRATIRADADMPDSVVRLNRWVTYRIDWGWPSESRILVCPEDYRRPSIHLSVLSPLGAALIGLSVGSRMPYLSFEGVLHVATVESLDPPFGLPGMLQSPTRGEGTR